MTAVTLFFIALALPLLAPLFMPNLKWLAGCVVLLVAALAGLKTWDDAQWREAVLHGYAGSPGDAFGALLVMTGGAALCLGVMLRLFAHWIRQAMRIPRR